MRILFSRALALAAGWALSASACRADGFPALYDSERDGDSARLDPATAAARLRLPPGFKATVFAAEPDVQNPVALAWDARGRLWVAENFTYAENPRDFDLGLRDRVLIFDDRNGDGRSDSRTVFTDDVQMLTSLEPGHGGVWLMCPPRLLFLPDRDRDDVPDASPEVVLDGFRTSTENHHTFANGLRWGPDGWLYGRCGASSPGLIGAPGATDASRVPLAGGLWRYHPQHRTFEALVHGTTNPWGHDWDAHGELFFINTVNGHLWHAIPGAHCVRSHTIDPNPHVYALIDHHADHWHFDTGRGLADAPAADAFGGGHVHVGMLIYQGDTWPAEYRGRLFTLNFHGRRANQDILERRGSGYVGRHAPDFFVSADPWFRGQELTCGPDGGVIVLDWSDTGECHEASGVHRTSGRIYKISADGAPARQVGDLETLDSDALVELHSHRNEWFVRQARRVLAGRAAAGMDLASASTALRRRSEEEADVLLRLRALWTLHVIGGADQAILARQLEHADEHVRTWGIRLLFDRRPLDTLYGQARGSGDLLEPAALAGFVRLATADTSGLVRLALASALQRLPVAQRPAVAARLLARAEDGGDQNLPLMLWYGVMPLADTDPSALVDLALACRLPRTRQLIARRLGEEIERMPGPLSRLLELSAQQPEPAQADILAGLSEALRGWRKATAPAGWDGVQTRLAASSNPALRERGRDLAVVFGDGRALDEVRRIALDSNAELDSRKAAVRTLIGNRPPDLRPICEQLLAVRFLNPVAASGLAGFDDPEAGGKLVAAYGRFHPTERPQLVGMLASRPAFARALLDAVAAGKIPRGDITAFHARQIRGLDNGSLARRLNEVWGGLHDSPAGKRRSIDAVRTQLTPAALAAGDRGRGRVLFSTVCASCHTLFGEGAEIGPGLTGAGRDNLDYLLENIIDPAAVVTTDFRLSVVSLKDGRVLNGVIKASSDRTLTLQTVPDLVTIERSEIERSEASTLSLMPDGLLDALTPAQTRDLIAYLMSPSQVPLP